MARKCTLTWIVRRPWIERHEAGLRRYLQSLENLRDCDHVVLTTKDDLLEVRQLCKGTEADVQIVPVTMPPLSTFSLDRNQAHVDFIEANPRYETYLVTDSRDVIFQEDVPVMDGLHLISEVLTYDESEWNRNDIAKLMGGQFENIYGIRSNPVINGGIQLGSGEQLVRFYQGILQYGQGDDESLTDQAVINAMVYFDRGSPEATVHGRESRLCFIGEAARIGVLNPQHHDGKFLHSSGEPYRIVHQWERIPVEETR